MSNHFPLSGSGYSIEAVDRFVSEVYDRMQTAIQRFRELEGELHELRRIHAAAGAGASAEPAVLIAEAQRRAAEIVAGGEAEAYEKVLGAQADVRDLFAAERQAMKELCRAVAEEREAFDAARADVRTQVTQLLTRLSGLEIEPVLDDQSAELPVAEAENAAEQVDEPTTQESFVAESLDEIFAEEADADDDDLAHLFDEFIEPAAAPADHSELFDEAVAAHYNPPTAPPASVASVLDAAQNLPEEAFEEFFVAEAEPEPSRSWLLGDYDRR